jgi:hypothetical protein
MSKKLKYPKIEYVESEENLHYLTLIKFRDIEYLCIIDNITDESISAYVLDNTQVLGINANEIIQIANRWFYRNSSRYPISFEFFKRRIAQRTNPMLKTFSLCDIQKIVGKPFIFNLYDKQKIRSRKIQPLPTTVEIRISKK